MDDLMLPPLPERAGIGYYYVLDSSRSGTKHVYREEDCYTADQVREYAKKAVEADRALRPTSGEYAQGYAEGFNDACKPAPLDKTSRNT